MQTNPALLQTARAASFFPFFLSNAVMMLGLAGVYLGETLAGNRVIPRWLALAGAAFSAVSMAGAIAGLIIGPAVMVAVGPVAPVATLITAIFGVRIATES